MSRNEPHLIRLRDWLPEPPADAAGMISYSRHFNRPTGLDGCRVLLAVEPSPPAAVRLNDAPLEPFVGGFLPATGRDPRKPFADQTGAGGASRWLLPVESLLARNSLQLMWDGDAEAHARVASLLSVRLEIYETEQD